MGEVMDCIKELYEKDINSDKIIEELVVLGMQVKLKELADKMVKVDNSEDLKSLIQELKTIQEAIKNMIENHERTIQIYNNKYKGEE